MISFSEELTWRQLFHHTKSDVHVDPVCMMPVSVVVEVQLHDVVTCVAQTALIIL
jgi:hypothetical protein